MRISIVGAGYVGLAVCALAEKGHEIILIDVDENKVNKINKGISPIFEEGLNEILKKYQIKATTDFDVIKDTDVTFICVGTPSNEDGSINLKYIESASEQIGKIISQKQNFHVIIVKSTITPGTTEEIIIPRIEKSSNKKLGDFGICASPEFLREGSAIKDFLHPDRIIIGCSDKKTEDFVTKLLKGIDAPVFKTNLKTAEMIKYASNAFLATKISFINEIGNLCKEFGIDTYSVAKGIGMDSRISPKFLESGIGFGGSCFNKDVMAIVDKGKQLGEKTPLLTAVLKVNDTQPDRIIKILRKHHPKIEDLKIGILGLAFKPNTDDTREAPSIKIIKKLKQENANITVYDPKAMPNTKNIFPDIKYLDNGQDVVDNSDLILILTEWEEFKNMNYGDKLVISGRRVFDVDNRPKNFEGVCW